MPTLTKSATLDTLGLSVGDHLVRFHVEEQVISFEIAASVPPAVSPGAAGKRQPTGFVQKWGGTARKIDDSEDAWLAHINDKHLQ